MRRILKLGLISVAAFLLATGFAVVIRGGNLRGLAPGLAILLLICSQSRRLPQWIAWGMVAVGVAVSADTLGLVQGYSWDFAVAVTSLVLSLAYLVHVLRTRDGKKEISPASISNH